MDSFGVFEKDVVPDPVTYICPPVLWHTVICLFVPPRSAFYEIRQSTFVSNIGKFGYKGILV